MRLLSKLCIFLPDFFCFVSKSVIKLVKNVFKKCHLWFLYKNKTL